jgi:hypothetical protein
MAIPGPGTPIDLTDIATEFNDDAPHSVSEFYRGGGLVPDSASNSAVPSAGAITLGNFYGAQNRVALALSITGNTNNYNLYTATTASPAYVPGTTDITLTVNPGVTVGSTSTGTYALSVPSDFNSGDNITFVNQGTIVGRAGNGGRGGNHPGGNGVAGQAGGHGLYINRPVTITNNGTIAGAGGGGGGSGSVSLVTAVGQKGATYTPIGGSGGGGGAGVQAGTGGAKGIGAPPPGALGSDPDVYNGYAGSSGNATQGGAGGPAKQRGNAPTGTIGATGAGGNGGARGANGQAGASATGVKQNPRPPGGGGSTGRYITGQSFATWQTTGTRLGGAS